MEGAARGLLAGKDAEAIAHALTRAVERARKSPGSAPPSLSDLTVSEKRLLRKDKTLKLRTRTTPIEVKEVTQVLQTGNSHNSQRILNCLGYDIRPDGEEYETVRYGKKVTQHYLMAYPPRRRKKART
jgi:hypothetical protein